MKSICMELRNFIIVVMCFVFSIEMSCVFGGSVRFDD
jgi:hypothetical protein